jgi:hypothetical protein
LDFGRTGILLVQLISFDHRILDILFQHFLFTFLSDLSGRNRDIASVKDAYPSSVILTAQLLYNRNFKK